MHSRIFIIVLLPLLLVNGETVLADDPQELVEMELGPVAGARKHVFVPLSVVPFNLTEFADEIETKLMGHCVGYQFVVSFNGTPVVKRAGGVARRAPDKSPRPMTTGDKYNIASISKTMTAIAAMKVLDQKGLHVGDTIGKFLPDSFATEAICHDKRISFRTLTFRELLTHKSGITCKKAGKLEALKACVAAGVLKTDKEEAQKHPIYNATNFQLFRILIPEIEAFTPPGTLAPSAGTIKPVHDYPKEYMAYVQKHVFDPAGLPKLFVKPTGAFPALGYHLYQIPCPEEGFGSDFGDQTQAAGAGGWTMSSEHLAMVLGTFLYTDKILPRALVEMMKEQNLGLAAHDVTNDLVSHGHGGWYPGFDDTGKQMNTGELGTLAYGLSNGVSVALFVNSQLGRNWNTRDIVDAAVKKMVK